MNNNSSVINNSRSNSKLISTFTATYSCVLEVKDKDIFRLPKPDIKEKQKNRAEIKTETEIGRGVSGAGMTTIKSSNKDAGKVANKGLTIKNKAIPYTTSYNMTFGYFNIEHKNNATLVAFPFLASIEVEVMRMGSYASVIPSSVSMTSKRLMDKETPTGNKNGLDNGTGMVAKEYNCTVKFNFDIPSAMRRNPDVEEVLQRLVLAKKIASESLVFNYLSLDGNDDDVFVVYDLESIDFENEGFNPISSSSGYESLTFSRSFIGYANSDIGKVKAYENERMKELELRATKKGADRQINDSDKILNDDEAARDSKAFALADKTAAIVRKERANDNLKKMGIRKNGRRNSHIVRDIEKSKVENPYNITFLPEGDIDFTNTWLAEDTSSDGGGLIQLSAVNSYIKERQVLDYDNFTVFTLRPVKKEANKTDAGDKEDLIEKKNDGSATVNDKSDIKTVMEIDANDPASRFAKTKHSFQMNIVLPRAILQLRVLDPVRLINSVFGVYDGIWRVMKISMNYTDSGQMTQEISVIPNYDYLEDFEKKSNVKVKKKNYDEDTGADASVDTAIA